MKIAIAAALLTLTAVSHSWAEPTAALAATVASKFSVDTPIEALAADPAAKAALDANFPGLTTHAMYDQFKGMSLKQLQPMAADKITDPAIAKLATDLAAIR